MIRTEKLKNALLTVFGVAVTGAAVSIFYIPNKIVNGGVSGISTILFYAVGLRPSISFALINLVLLGAGFRVLGSNFVIKTIVCSGLLSLFVDLFSHFPPLTHDVFLATVFGAALYGVGIGIALANGASTGGTDIIGRLIQYRFPQLPIGKILLAVDATVITTSLIMFKNIDLTLYGVVALFASTFAIDWLIGKLNISKLAFVISDKGEEISKLLVSTSPRGVTRVSVVGTYSNTDKVMLICALKENELPAFQKKILAVDADAFIIFSESQQIIGEGFYVYR